jgi:hypothetical protein
MRTRVLQLSLAATIAVGGAIGACSTSGDEPPLGLNPGADGGDDTSLPGEGGDEDTAFNLDAAPVDPDAASLSIEPADQIIDVTVGGTIPTISYVAKASGAPVAVAWAIDRGEIGALAVSTGVFTPTGNLGGKATITATYGAKKATTTVTVRLKMTQNGDTGGGPGGSGGVGGVGGEGPGAAVPDATKAILDAAPTADAAVKWLYPYDNTVWPRGLLAPLLQWERAGHSFDAVKITIKETAFEFTGTFTKTSTPFLHHPVPQDAWKKMSYSNGGEPVTVELVFAEGGKTIGPIKQTWKIAKGPLKGTVYYNSYGTKLAENYCCTLGTAKKFGGATLAIKAGAMDPTLVAGGTGGEEKCRVCHSVSAGGSALITQWGNGYGGSSTYALTAGYSETPMAPSDGRFAWPAMYPDGSLLFSNSSTAAGGSTTNSALYAVPTGAAVAATGIPSGLRAGIPAFSPDGKHVSFAFNGGPGADSKSLASVDFDIATKAFSNLVVLNTPSVGTNVWSSWLPNSEGVVFERETLNNGRDYAGTRSTCDSSAACSDTGARGELWWVDTKTKTATRLDKANGSGIVPVGANAHDKDETLNFEPSVNPVVSGGYAWVVFVSRRMYGNVATINPYWSDPRYHDISSTPTTKKLWVAAIDLSAPPGTDPSSPAFYLPGQELLAGNSRGFWVVDPCKMESATCETGDECCGGFCQPGADGKLTCTNKPPVCAAEYEKCTKDDDCCGLALGVKCIGGRCAAAGPK